MTEFIALALLLVVVAFAMMTRGAWWKHRAAAAPNEQVAALGRQMDQLRELHKAGMLTDDQFAQAAEKVRARIAEYGGTSTGTVPITAQAPGRGLLAAIGLIFVATVSGGYALLGSPGSVSVAPGMASAGGGAGAGHSVTNEQILGMIDKLAERLKQQPDDPVGWGMLARSYVAIGKPAEALVAYKKAVELRGNDADLLADYADALAVANNRSLDGEPAALIERALKADPNHVKALALAGTVAYNHKDYALTLKLWERAVQVSPPDNPFLDDLRNGITEVRQLAGLGPAPAASGAAPAALAAVATPAAPLAADGKGSVSGTVTLAAALASKADPQDTVFIFARPADGSRMPLAILKKQVRDLPMNFVLDDSLAMSPAAKISAAGKVMVSARVSKSGNAAPQPGDLQGAVGPVAVGTDGIKIEIGDVVAK